MELLGHGVGDGGAHAAAHHGHPLQALCLGGLTQGMCGGCRLSVGGETKFACVDGPEFDGHKVDFDEAMARCSFV